MHPAKARGALATLALGVQRRLTRDWPPSLSAVASWLTAANSYAEFKSLVQEYVPQQAKAILGSEGAPEMVAAFAHAFQDRYFPLLSHVLDGDCEGFEDIVTAIPVEVQGWEYEAYHELPNDRPGIVLSALLVDFETEMGEEGIRITLLEKAQEWLPQDLLKRTRAYDMEFLAFALKKRYRGLLCFGAHLLHATGLYFLDVPMDEIYGMGCRATGPPNWEAETVEGLTQEWKQAERLMKEEGKFWAWLEKDPKAHLTQVLDFLEAKWKPWSKRKPKKP